MEDEEGYFLFWVKTPKGFFGLKTRAKSLPRESAELRGRVGEAVQSV
jgi:hypothetical protein